MKLEALKWIHDTYQFDDKHVANCPIFGKFIIRPDIINKYYVANSNYGLLKGHCLTLTTAKQFVESWREDMSIKIDNEIEV